MSLEPDRLEHLFTRYLDGECTPQERKLVDQLRREHPAVRSLFEEYRDLDRQVGNALRSTMGRSQRTVFGRGRWERVGRGLAVAVAAGLAALVWLRPTPPPADRLTAAASQANAAGSWFMPVEPVVDTLEALPTAYERPELRLRGTQRELIIVPSDRPDTYLVIEVDRVRTHVIGVHRDF